MRILFLSVCILLQQFATAQSSTEPIIRVDKITIARDTYGVPHIYLPPPTQKWPMAWPGHMQKMISPPFKHSY